MSTSKEVIAQLNILLKNELTAINQYFLHAKMLKHLGYATFAAQEHAESIEEMKHADQIMERIFMIGGLPNLQDIGKLRIGENPIEIIRCDHAMELEVVRDLREAHRVCEEARDPISTNLVEMILDAEERHLEGLNARLAHIDALGVQVFLQTLL